MTLHLQSITPPAPNDDDDDEAVSFGIEITRTDTRTGDVQRIGWDGYGLLRELIEGIVDEADKRGWLADT
jgi:hypothetical protein